MSLLLWLQRLFVPKPDAEENEETNFSVMEEESPFTWNQHTRIVLAMVIAFISAFVIWWIVT